jgi:hypothetical protein
MKEIIDKVDSKIIPEQDIITPNRINHFITHPEQNHISGEALWDEMPPEIKGVFISGKGNLKKDKKYRRFILSLEELLDAYKPIDIMKMDEDCIRKDGTIDKSALDDLLEDFKHRQNE